MEVNSSCFSFAVSLILWLLFCLCLLFSELFHTEQKDFQERALSTTISTISAARLRWNWCSNFFEILWIKAAPHNSWQSHKAVKTLEKYLNPISWHWIITGIAHSQSQPRGAAFATELCACSRGLSRAGGFTLNREGIYGDVLWQRANPSYGMWNTQPGRLSELGVALGFCISPAPVKWLCAFCVLHWVSVHPIRGISAFCNQYFNIFFNYLVLLLLLFFIIEYNFFLNEYFTLIFYWAFLPAPPDFNDKFQAGPCVEIRI